MTSDALIVPSPVEGKSSALKVNAARVFSAAIESVDGALGTLRPIAEKAAAVLADGNASEDAAPQLKTVVDSWLRVVEARAKLACEQGKVLVEMQKDLNRCAVERERIASSPKSGLDLNSLSAESIRAALAGMEDDA
jgi:hypothetical protein